MWTGLGRLVYRYPFFVDCLSLLANIFIINTQQKMNNLLQVDENSNEQYFAAHIVPGC